MSSSGGKSSNHGTSLQTEKKSTTMPAPLLKPRPLPRPAGLPKSVTLTTKPLLLPKPRRLPPSALGSTRNKNNNVTAPERPFKPRHLQEQENIIKEEEEKTQLFVSEQQTSATCSSISISSSSSSVDTVHIIVKSAKCEVQHGERDIQSDYYDDVEVVVADKDPIPGDDHQGFHPARRKDTSGTPNHPVHAKDNNIKFQPPSARPKPLPPKKPLPPLIQKPSDSTSNSQSVHKPCLPSKPPPDLPSSAPPKPETSHASVAALAHKLKNVPMFPVNTGDNKQNATLAATTKPACRTSPRHSPCPSPSFPFKLDPPKVTDSLVKTGRGNDKLPVVKPKVVRKSSLPLDQRTSTKDEGGQSKGQKKPVLPVKPTIYCRRSKSLNRLEMGRSSSSPTMGKKKEERTKPYIPVKPASFSPDVTRQRSFSLKLRDKRLSAINEPSFGKKKEETTKPYIPVKPASFSPDVTRQRSFSLKLRDKRLSAINEPSFEGKREEKSDLPAKPTPSIYAEELVDTQKSKAKEKEGKNETYGTPTMDEPPRKISDSGIQKKRIASRRQLPPPTTQNQRMVTPTASEVRKRRPPPPPPASAGAEDSSPQRKGPPVPKSFLRVGPAHGHSPARSITKARSAENIRKSAEDQSLYAYAYEHAFTPPRSPQTNVITQPVNTDEIDYVEPDTSAVAEFMDELKHRPSDKPDAYYEVEPDDSVAESLDSLETKNSGLGQQDAYYEIEPDDSVAESMDSLETKNSGHGQQDSSGEGTDSEGYEYVYPDEAVPDDSKDEGLLSSDTDTEHEYEYPPESPPPVPACRDKLSGSYDLTEARENESSSEEEENDYVEPFEVEGDSDEERDTFLDDDDDYETEEPLYQVYAARTLERDRTLSRKRTSSSFSDTTLEDLTQGTLRNMRMLWCEIPEIRHSGVLDVIDQTERKRQEAMFEVITSEASYLKSLNILQSHFIDSPELTPGAPQSVLEKTQHRILFSNVRIILEVSKRFLDSLRHRQRESLVISSISDIIEEYATKYFDVYVKYCSNQIYQDRVFKALRKTPRFSEGIERLEKCSTAQCLTLQSFLVLPMQRITRLPLLVDAICHRCEEGGDEFHKTDRALKAINKVVYDCNEGARKMERMEEMVALQALIEFTVKPIALVSSNRWLLRRGEIILVTEAFKSPMRKKVKQKPVYMFLFNDLLLITKKKSETRYRVLDYANRSMTKVEVANEPSIQLDHMLSLILLENCNGKTQDFLLCAASETDKTRWLEAFNPPKAEREGETVYGAWDCPQVQAIHNYMPQQPDELALHVGDVINVQRKLRDGWYHGERLCDGVLGWFPANHTENIRNEHIRARNLLQRYRLLAASKHLIGAVQTMKLAKPTKSVKGILTV